ncbi:hypothetical protein TSUD_355570 [Trifolium subterraneum]|uniref:RNase H type-1 domain-containing protein n=1 Tax=Trifolium subterraneum TaxID=3900 RepID=A0A2Z6M1P5_TRISU|nr:hypothetical protein TSUD_355570 [Trifolium subterraneum]
MTNHILAIPPPNALDGRDMIGWGGTNTRHFNIQSAYNLQCGADEVLVFLLYATIVEQQMKRSSTCYEIALAQHKDWIFKNITNDFHGTHALNWTSTFMMAKEIDNGFHNMWSYNQHETIFIGWRKPREGWVKLNCDGSQNDGLGLVGCSGLLRNSDGNWLKGYSRKLGNCDALHAEMWSMYLGLDLARRVGIMHLHVESDSKVLIDMVTKKINSKGNLPTLVHHIRQLLDLNWQVQLSHTWREGNRSVD